MKFLKMGRLLFTVAFIVYKHLSCGDMRVCVCDVRQKTPILDFRNTEGGNKERERILAIILSVH